MTKSKWPDFKAAFNQWDAFVNSPGGMPRGWKEFRKPNRMPLLVWEHPDCDGVYTSTTINNEARFKLRDFNVRRHFYKCFDTLEEAIAYTNEIRDKDNS